MMNISSRVIIQLPRQLHYFVSSYHQQIRYLSSSIDAIHPTIAGRTRFYKHVTVERVLRASIDDKSHPPPNTQQQQKWCILLDGRMLRTPQRNPLHLPSESLAMLIAAEWDAQTNARTGIMPSTMPLMTLTATAIDQFMLGDRSIGINTCLSYLPTDSTLFFTTSEDRILQHSQKKHYTPLLKWFARHFRITLHTSETMHGRIVHPEEDKRRIASMIEMLDPFALACLQCATMESKSLVIALALLSRDFTLQECIAASRVEEEFQIEVWGVVEGGHDMDRLNNSVALSSASVFMHFLWSQQHTKAMMHAWKKIK